MADRRKVNNKKALFCNRNRCEQSACTAMWKNGSIPSYTSLYQGELAQSIHLRPMKPVTTASGTADRIFFRSRAKRGAYPHPILATQQFACNTVLQILMIM